MFFGNDIRFNIYEKSLFLGLIFSILLSFINFSAKCNRISEKIFRLHIIANSNSEEDQSLKIKIRDDIIKYFSNKNFKSLEDAQDYAFKNIDNIKKICENRIKSEHFNYNIKVEICKNEFKNKKYDSVIIPAGTYESLRIIIGKGDGKNWWCVLFPQMCIPAAEDCNIDPDYDLFDDEKNIIENEEKYKVEFKIVDIFQSIHEMVLNLFCS